ncbi:hypothetical protein [Helicobacter sp. T3_23-1056]
MFLPLRCLVNLRLEASFVGLENGLEILSGNINALCFAKSTSDDIYALLWELGSNVLKYGLRKSSQNVSSKTSCNADFVKSTKLDLKNIDLEKIDSSKINLKAFVYSDFVEISLHYKTGFTLANFHTKNDAKNPNKQNTQKNTKQNAEKITKNPPKNPKSTMPKSTMTFAITPPKTYSLHYYELQSQDFSHIDSSHLGNKVIAYLAEKICYDTPKIFFLNARERILRVRILPKI